MAIKRRDFLKLAGSMGAGAVYALYGTEMSRLFAQSAGVNHVVWLQGSSDSGCTISLLQGVDPDLVDAITNFRLAVDFNPTLMIPSGDQALAALSRAASGAVPLDLLIVEGAVPAGDFCSVGEINGRPVTLETWVRTLSGRARRVVAVGTCAAFGGIPAAVPNPTNCRPVSAFVSRTKLINIPGCPAHPDWVLLTLATLLSGSTPSLDDRRRPKAFFGEKLHDDCPLKELDKARELGQTGCLVDLGCRGKITQGDCPNRLWNNKTSFCMSGPVERRRPVYNAGAPCIGCTEPGFPDPPFSPFYDRAGEGGEG